MTFAERLRELRTEAHMTLDEVGNRIGVGRATIYKYEHGIIENVPTEKVHQLANMFGVSRPYLMGWTDEPHANPSENLDMVAEKLSMPMDKAFKSEYWRTLRGRKLDCTTAATQALRALIKFRVAHTPIYPHQVLQASQHAAMITFADQYELLEIIGNTNVITSSMNDYVMSSIYTDEEGKTIKYLISTNRTAPIGDLRLAIAVELGHIYLGHNSHMNMTKHMLHDAECFALHFEFPRPLIKLLQERGYVFTEESFARIFGECEWCMDRLMTAPAVKTSPELNRMVKEQFTPYVDVLDDIGIMMIPAKGKVIDLSKYMEGYED